MRTMRTTPERDPGECHAPDCSGPALPGRNFCRICQAVLDRVRKELESGRGANPGGNANRIPTVQSIDDAKAASFDEGLRRRANKRAPTDTERLTRAVRIIQLRNGGKSDDAIVAHLCLSGTEELEEDLERYRARTRSKAIARTNGLRRDVQLDEAIMTKLKTFDGTRQELAGEIGISYSALASRITRLRRDGYEIPDARKIATKEATKDAIAA
ncbi:MAG: hypothetical protein J0H98_10615 [Solirubrobacterales bacterium]|nr:hypothetical protein [Solirubrobacterales bacterium]